MTSDTPALSRAGRRTRTRAAILEAARELFRELGYERTTIRAVAGRAGVDPALVMQHFGSKATLFSSAAEIELDLTEAIPGPPDQLGDRLLAHLLDRLETAPDATLSTLRSMLTHEQAADAVRGAIVDSRADRLAGALTGEDAALRSGLIHTILIGLMVTRYLLKVPEVTDAPVSRLTELLGPGLRALVKDQ